MSCNYLVPKKPCWQGFDSVYKCPTVSFAYPTESKFSLEYEFCYFADGNSAYYGIFEILSMITYMFEIKKKS